MSSENQVQAPMAKLSSVVDTEDIPPGMLLRVYDMPGGGEPLAPFEVSHWSLQPGTDSGDDLHGARELWLIAAGRGEMTCGGATMQVAAGDVISIEPRQPHRLVNTGSGPVEVFSVWWAS
jgi:mannose-6-phosphate isomerase-like protein (cupin superfamily)